MAQAPAYLPTETQLGEIAARFGLGRLESWRRMAGGVVNPALLLNEGTVLRINVRDKELPKVAREAWALDFVARFPAPEGWRVPAVIGADTARDIIPFDYLLLGFLPGRVASDLWETLPLDGRADLSRQCGRALAHLHSLPLPGSRYGDWDLTRGELGDGDDWREMMISRNRHLLAQAERLSFLPSAEFAAVARWLDDHLPALPVRPRRVLVHGDFGLWNALVEPGAPVISAIFDFEWVQAGPPALDFAPLFFDARDPLDPAAFLTGYADLQPFDSGALREALYYEMQYHLDLLGVVHKFWGGSGDEVHHENIAALLAGRPTWGYARAGCAWPF